MMEQDEELGMYDETLVEAALNYSTDMLGTIYEELEIEWDDNF